MELENKVALVTGAGSGIGKAAAKLLAQEGAKVALVSRTQEELEKVKGEIEADGGTAMVITADISKPADMEAACQKIDAEWGRLDVVFAHAGVNGVWAPVDELETDEWAKTIGINLNGTFHTVKYTVPMLKKQNGGSIIITSSINGTRKFTMGGASAYAASKAGVFTFGKMLALELAKHRIRVNIICPGAIATDVEQHTTRRDVDEASEPVEYPEGKIPLTDGEPGRPEQVADLVLFLASDRSSHITGTPIWIDGGESLLEG
ncbi:MAG: SDR family oxidoreductase [Rhodothermales bacterium]